MVEKEKIELAKELEKQLQQYKLYTDLVPEDSWYINLRNLISRSKWKELRQAIIKSQQYECAICKVITSLHVHERWNYNYKTEVQQLEELIGICNRCHYVIHLGYAEIKAIPEGKITMEELAKHWSKINEEPSHLFFKQRQCAYKLWNIRNSIQWTVKDQNGVILAKT